MPDCMVKRNILVFLVKGMAVDGGGLDFHLGFATS